MKISDILKKQQALLEAPLGSYNLLSGSSGEDFDPSRPDSPGWDRGAEPKALKVGKPEPFFRRSDRTAIHNPKTVETLQRVFDRFDFNVHFVFINDRENHNFTNMSDFPTQGKTMMSYISQADHINFIQELRNSDINSLIVVFRGNDPEGYEHHVSMTAWMMVHRMTHALPTLFKSRELGDSLRELGTKLIHASSDKFYRYMDHVLVPYHFLFPMRSARLLKLSTEAGAIDEIQRECFTQTLFNPNWKLKPLTEDIKSKHGRKMDNTDHYYHLVEVWVEEYKQHVAKVMANASRGTIYL